MNSIRQGTEM